MAPERSNVGRGLCKPRGHGVHITANLHQPHHTLQLCRGNTNTHTHTQTVRQSVYSDSQVKLGRPGQVCTGRVQSAAASLLLALPGAPHSLNYSQTGLRPINFEPLTTTLGSSCLTKFQTLLRMLISKRLNAGWFFVGANKDDLIRHERVCGRLSAPPLSSFEPL